MAVSTAVPGVLLTRKRSQVQTLSRPPLFSQVRALSIPRRSSTLLHGPRWGRTPSRESNPRPCSSRATPAPHHPTTTHRSHRLGASHLIKASRRRSCPQTPTTTGAQPSSKWRPSRAPAPSRDPPTRRVTLGRNRLSWSARPWNLDSAAAERVPRRRPAPQPTPRPVRPPTPTTAVRADNRAACGHGGRPRRSRPSQARATPPAAPTCRIRPGADRADRDARTQDADRPDTGIPTVDAWTLPAAPTRSTNSTPCGHRGRERGMHGCRTHRTPDTGHRTPDAGTSHARTLTEEVDRTTTARQTPAHPGPPQPADRRLDAEPWTCARCMRRSATMTARR
jgi:hypothetical protein